MTESQKRIAAERQRLAEKYRNNPIGEGTNAGSISEMSSSYQ